MFLHIFAVVLIDLEGISIQIFEAVEVDGVGAVALAKWLDATSGAEAVVYLFGIKEVSLKTVLTLFHSHLALWYKG